METRWHDPPKSSRVCRPGRNVPSGGFMARDQPHRGARGHARAHRDGRHSRDGGHCRDERYWRSGNHRRVGANATGAAEGSVGARGCGGSPCRSAKRRRIALATQRGSWELGSSSTVMLSSRHCPRVSTQRPPAPQRRECIAFHPRRQLCLYAKHRSEPSATADRPSTRLC